MALLKNPLKQYRLTAFLEGLSLILLVFVTTPLKYMYEQPLGSKILGPLHGVLFIVFVYFTFYMKVKYQWSWKRTMLLLLASIVPFGTFIADAVILKKAAQEQQVH